MSTLTLFQAFCLAQTYKRHCREIRGKLMGIGVQKDSQALIFQRRDRQARKFCAEIEKRLEREKST